MKPVEFDDINEAFIARGPLCLLDSEQWGINRQLEGLPRGLLSIRSRGGKHLAPEIWSMVLGFLEAMSKEHRRYPRRFRLVQVEAVERDRPWSKTLRCRAVEILDCSEPDLSADEISDGYESDLPDFDFRCVGNAAQAAVLERFIESPKEPIDLEALKTRFWTELRHISKDDEYQVPCLGPTSVDNTFSVTIWKKPDRPSSYLATLDAPSSRCALFQNARTYELIAWLGDGKCDECEGYRQVGCEGGSRCTGNVGPRWNMGHVSCSDFTYCPLCMGPELAEADNYRPYLHQSDWDEEWDRVFEITKEKLGYNRYD